MTCRNAMGRGRPSTPAAAARPWTGCSPKLCSRSRPTPTRPTTSAGWSRSTPPSSALTSTPPPRAEKKGGGADRTDRTITPSPLTRRTNHQDPPCLRRQGPPARDPGDARPTPRQCLCTSFAGTDPCSAHRRGPAALQARPGHRRQGLQLPRLPCLPATTRYCAHHPRED